MSRLSIVGGRKGGLTLLALVAAAIGLVLVVVAVSAQRSAPQPPRSVGSIDPAAGSPSASAPPEVTAARTKPLGASRPVSISIPSIKVRSAILPIGLAPDGTLAVPQPGPNLDKAAWFKNSPTPGQPGPSIIEGHVDSDRGPSVFFRLGSLRPGDTIRVTRADGVVATFTVNAVRDYKKSKFPTDVVYGGKDLSRPQLRLITCSDFDASIRHHVGNEVVFAHLTSTQRPQAGKG
ncbi:MAG: class F sortase [Nocardioidaceae bacterium]